MLESDNEITAPNFGGGSDPLLHLSYRLQRSYSIQLVKLSPTKSSLIFTITAITQVVSSCWCLIPSRTSTRIPIIKCPLKSSTLFLHLFFLTPLRISFCAPKRGYGCGREASRWPVGATAKVTKGQCLKRTTTMILLHRMAAQLFTLVRCRRRSGNLCLQIDPMGLAPLVLAIPRTN